MFLSRGKSAGSGDEQALPRSGVFALARLKQDRAAVTALVLATSILLACFVAAPILSRVLGHGPNDLFPYAVDGNLRPVGPLSRVPDTHAALVDDFGEIAPPAAGTDATLLILGGDGALGRDLFLRILYGGQVSIEVGALAALIALLIGVAFGALAGMMGGLVDAGVSRLSEVVMAFPILFLLVLVGASSFGSHLQDVTFGVLNEGVFAVALLIGLFTWFYPARLVRTQLHTLRRSEFVDASVVAGAGPVWIFRRHLVPHVGPSLLTWGMLAVATGILLEIGVTFLNAGVRLPTSSWGRILADTWGSPLAPSRYNPAAVTLWPTIFTSTAIFLTVVALHELGEGLQRMSGANRTR
jgi:ABC-type dipeptide/oligopeptide/nickel transport system permease subunit